MLFTSKNILLKTVILMSFALLTSNGFAEEAPATTTPPATAPATAPAAPVATAPAAPAVPEIKAPELKAPAVQAPAVAAPEVKAPEMKAAAEMNTPPVPPPAAPQHRENYFGLHGAVGLPNPITYGLDYIHSSGLFSMEVSGGAYSFKYQGADIDLKNTQVGLRWHPWAGSFFLGAAYGSRTISGSKSDTVSGIPATVKAEVKSNYATPMLGWLWGAKDGGFFAGMEFGWQIPSGVTTDISTNAPASIQAQATYQTLDSDVRDAAKKVGDTALPHITLLKLGWLF